LQILESLGIREKFVFWRVNIQSQGPAVPVTGCFSPCPALPRAQQGFEPRARCIDYITGPDPVVFAA